MHFTRLEPFASVAQPAPRLGDMLNKVLRRFPVLAAYLFGSLAEGRARPDSDIDLALVPDGPGLGAKRLEIFAALVEAGVDNVDLVILDTGEVVTRFEAVRQNCLVYARDDFDAGAYYSRSVREYLDFQPYLTRQRMAMKRRLLDGSA